MDLWKASKIFVVLTGWVLLYYVVMCACSNDPLARAPGCSLNADDVAFLILGIFYALLGITWITAK